MNEEEQNYREKMKLLDDVTQSVIEQDGDKEDDMRNLHIIDKLLDICLEKDKRIAELYYKMADVSKDGRQ